MRYGCRQGSSWPRLFLGWMWVREEGRWGEKERLTAGKEARRWEKMVCIDAQVQRALNNFPYFFLLQASLILPSFIIAKLSCTPKVLLDLISCDIALDSCPGGRWQRGEHAHAV